MVNRKLILGAGVPALLFVLFGAAFWAYSLMGSGGASGSWSDYRSAETLLAASDRVVLATYLDEETHEIPTVTAEDGTVLGSVTERFHRFRIVEPLRGDGLAGEDLHVVSSVGYKTALPTGGSESHMYDLVDLTAGEKYVLFLHARTKIDGYPDKYGDVLWTRPDEPGIAQLDSSGRLSFIATDRYKETIKDEGLERASGSDAPFEMTKDDIASSPPAK